MQMEDDTAHVLSELEDWRNVVEKADSDRLGRGLPATASNASRRFQRTCHDAGDIQPCTGWQLDP